VLSPEVDVFDAGSMFQKTPGCLASDNRNVYDKLQSDELARRELKEKLTLNFCV